jgi:hypothetical protein
MGDAFIVSASCWDLMMGTTIIGNLDELLTHAIHQGGRNCPLERVRSQQGIEGAPRQNLHFSYFWALSPNYA